MSNTPVASGSIEGCDGGARAGGSVEGSGPESTGAAGVSVEAEGFCSGCAGGPDVLAAGAAGVEVLPEG